MKDYNSILVKGISYFFILLFIYASVSKLLEFEKFQVQLAQSPLLSAYAGSVSYAVIITEWVVSILLLVPNFRRIGLYGSLILMSAFTAYIFMILNYSDFVPCSCGGILEKLGWTEHLVFNISCLILCIIAIYLLEKKIAIRKQQTTFSLLVSFILSVALIISLFLSSEHVIKKENNFTRRFIKHSIIEHRSVKLDNDFYYFAGYDDNNIYLSNQKYPQQLTTIDSSMHKTSVTSARIETEHPYKNIRQIVLDKHFYIFDGSVPIIFKGKLGTEFTKRISYKDAFFNDLKVIDSSHFAVRTQVRPTNYMVVGIFDLESPEKLQLKPKVLQKQIDGRFDVDGSMTYENHTKKLLYTYTYRNQVVIMNRHMDVQQLLKTIDTVKTAQIKTTKLSDGNYKMSAPALRVNIRSIVYKNLLFVQSNLMGRHESRKAWKKSDVLDVYNIDAQSYVGSIYIFKKDDHTLTDIIVTEKFLYTIHNNELTQYKITKALSQYIKSGMPKTDQQSRQH
ncbi:tellurium resistance protein TerC [Elizabethkingia sp. HX QKY]|uniref:MauE/DoxX family redox-associated membrane protein n=1 Tax=Elizabethkingia TaxID=308865 RepID=UPI002A23B4D5|nr:MauE/DoxX family redox-associated membrane protein [Elizabethkingia sp. HX QKY]MDX8572204.1 tellurium resistance protein TerC [Elizabethkingia sp. HX QKY]